MEILGSTSNFNEVLLHIHATISAVSREVEEAFWHSTGHLLKMWLILVCFAAAFLAPGNPLLYMGGKDLPRWRILRTKRQFEKAAAPKTAASSPFYMHLAGVSRSRQDQMGTRRLQPVSIRW